MGQKKETKRKAKSDVIANLKDKRDFALSVSNHLNGDGVSEMKYKIYDKLVEYVENEF